MRTEKKRLDRTAYYAVRPVGARASEPLRVEVVRLTPSAAIALARDGRKQVARVG